MTAASDLECLTKELALLLKNNSKFMENVSDGLLFEILLRLPDSRAAIQSATVCKRWHSLIAAPHFRKSFIEYHRNKRYSDFSILFHCSFSRRVPYYKLHLKESENVAHPYDLSFIPDYADMEIKATCGDLLLVGRFGKSVLKAAFRYCICDSLTLQCFALPQIPPFTDFKSLVPHITFQGSFGYALVCHPNDQSRFRVVLIYKSRFDQARFMFRAAIFNSDTSQWTFEFFEVPYDMPDHVFFQNLPLDIVLTSRGTLHWLDGMEDLIGVASFNPFSSEVRLILLPSGEFNGISPRSGKDKVRLGVVQGRLRLSRMHRINDRCVGLRIWEMESGDDSWRLVHDVVMETPSGVELDGILLFVLAFDPSDGNTVFLVRDKAIYRYEIEQDAYELVCEFPIPCLGHFRDTIRSKKAEVAKYFKVFTLVSPLWPGPFLLEVKERYGISIIQE